MSMNSEVINGIPRNKYLSKVVYTHATYCWISDVDSHNAVGKPIRISDVDSNNAVGKPITNLFLPDDDELLCPQHGTIGVKDESELTVNENDDYFPCRGCTFGYIKRRTESPCGCYCWSCSCRYCFWKKDSQKG
jgi:hypothetical protein